MRVSAPRNGRIDSLGPAWGPPQDRGSDESTAENETACMRESNWTGGRAIPEGRLVVRVPEQGAGVGDAHRRRGDERPLKGSQGQCGVGGDLCARAVRVKRARRIRCGEERRPRRRLSIPDSGEERVRRRGFQRRVASPGRAKCRADFGSSRSGREYDHRNHRTRRPSFKNMPVSHPWFIDPRGG